MDYIGWLGFICGISALGLAAQLRSQVDFLKQDVARLREELHRKG
jgi:hypothetical protein